MREGRRGVNGVTGGGASFRETGLMVEPTAGLLKSVVGVTAINKGSQAISIVTHIPLSLSQRMMLLKRSVRLSNVSFTLTHIPTNAVDGSEELEEMLE